MTLSASSAYANVATQEFLRRAAPTTFANRLRPFGITRHLWYVSEAKPRGGVNDVRVNRTLDADPKRDYGCQ
jgi:hypothetical protein